MLPVATVRVPGPTRRAAPACLGRIVVGCLALGLLAGPAEAQMVLPGAVAPTPEGASQAPAAAPKARPKATSNPDGPVHLAPAQVVPATALAGRTLALNGGASQITFEPHDKDLDVSRLVLKGELISNPRESCQVQTPSMPIAVTHVGKPDGVDRIQIAFPACPVAFDVLDGAALVDPAQAVCEFKQADCRVNPVGLWGPVSSELGPDKAKAIEHARAHAEGAVRANYKALIAAAGKDRVAVMGIAREQAQFSSTREETCRDYVGEGRHGFCATKLTEARAALLRVRLGGALEAKAARKQKRLGQFGRS